MEDLSVTLVQSDIFWENPEANRNHLEELLAGQNQLGDLIVLPEMFTTGFTMNAAAVAEPMNFHSIKWMHQQAQLYNATIVGSIAIKDGKQYYNRLCVVNSNGLAGYYDKRHLFSYAREETVYTAGVERLGFTIKGWNIMPLICYDLRFPVWSRNVDNTIDLYLYIANWPQLRIDAWDCLLKARAIENLSYVVGVNRVGVDGNEVEYNGHSAAVDYKGKVIEDLEDRARVITAKLSAEDLIQFRKNFPFHQEADNFEINI